MIPPTSTSLAVLISSRLALVCIVPLRSQTYRPLIHPNVNNWHLEIIEAWRSCARSWTSALFFQDRLTTRTHSTNNSACKRPSKDQTWVTRSFQKPRMFSLFLPKLKCFCKALLLLLGWSTDVLNCAACNLSPEWKRWTMKNKGVTWVVNNSLKFIDHNSFFLRFLATCRCLVIFEKCW